MAKLFGVNGSKQIGHSLGEGVLLFDLFLPVLRRNAFGNL